MNVLICNHVGYEGIQKTNEERFSIILIHSLHLLVCEYNTCEGGAVSYVTRAGAPLNNQKKVYTGRKNPQRTRKRDPGLSRSKCTLGVT